MNKHPKKAPARILAAALAAVMITSSVQIVTHAADAGSTQTQEQEVSAFRFKYPAEHSFAEINQFYAEHPYDTSLPDVYDAIPDIANEEINNRIGDDTSALLDAKGKADRDKLAGSLSQETLNNALNATNFMRYSAGLQLLYIHTNDRIGGFQWRAQAGAALLAELGTITHNVSGAAANAAGIVNGVFGWAKAGPGGSNCVAGTGVANKMVNSFMPDIGNDRTGLSHRSYILNPGLSGTGFGAANLSGKNKAGTNRGSAVTMMVTYAGADPDGLTAVLWPGNRQPIETFQARGTWTMKYPEGNPYQGNPWSYFINTNDAKVDTSTFMVTLECDGKPTDILDFNNLTAAEKSENRLFTINSNPLKRLIAFRPHVAYDAGDKVTVTIEGIVDSQNLPIPVSYDVHFFQTGTEPHPNLENRAVSRTAEDTAKVSYTADYAGAMRYLVLDANAAEPTAEQVLAGTEIYLGTDPATLDLTALTGSGAKKLYYITISTTGAGKEYAAASKSGEMSAVKSIDIPEYTTVPVSYTVSYDWGTDFPAGETLPVNGTVYQSEDEAKAAVDTHYTIGYTVEGQKDGKAGTWSFSGWTASLDGTTVKFTGSWTFTESSKVDAAAPAAITLVNASYEVGDTIAALDGTTTVSDDGIISYQWYSSDAADNFNGTAILGETNAVYTPAITAAGTYYYYVVAVNTKADATGNTTASTTSNMAVITVRDKDVPATYTVFYDWGMDFPAGETLPVDGAVYRTEDEAKAAVDTKYTAGYAVKAQKNGKNGTWTFSGWITAVEGTTVKFTGSWSFVEDTPAPVVTPSYTIKAEDTANGKLTLSTSRAARGRMVTITVTPDEGFILGSLTVRDRNGNLIAVTKATENKYTFKMPSSAVTVSASFEAEAKEPIQFADVKESDWYYDAVQWAARNGITTGTENGLFSPAGLGSRAEVVTFLWRAAGSPEPTITEHSFVDIDSSAYYCKTVLWAIENGITVGTGKTTFSPDVIVTRAQMVTFLARAAKASTSDSDSRFADVADGAWYTAAVNWADDNGVTNGIGGGKFGPEADCTRAQIVVFLYRIYGK